MTLFDESNSGEQSMFARDATRDIASIHCDECGNVLYDGVSRCGDYTTICANNTCESWCCRNCDSEWAGYGPVGCRVCNPRSMWETIIYVLWYVFIYPIYVIKRKLWNARRVK